ncbi:cytochrome C biogenesis protein CcsB [Anopheles sinensis]|uniref:Cytochrome C biogenesis protein CcsB n=1 Tax=Anopheles sinensis TaxID=74873 RepID=A0A084VPT8_ANOSI|nr:cytochrome C biogenesis protein CcsB [Anopheles sinensis]
MPLECIEAEGNHNQNRIIAGVGIIICRIHLVPAHQQSSTPPPEPFEGVQRTFWLMVHRCVITIEE